jgi:hypothetical protein
MKRDWLHMGEPYPTDDTAPRRAPPPRVQGPCHTAKRTYYAVAITLTRARLQRSWGGANKSLSGTQLFVLFRKEVDRELRGQTTGPLSAPFLRCAYDRIRPDSLGELT